MPNIIDSIQLSGVTYTLSGSSSGGSNNVVELTQAEYDALATKDPTAFYIITDAHGVDISSKLDTSAFTAYSAATDTAIAGKQTTLVSGTNIKTINNESILGSGNITVSADTSNCVTTGTTQNITGEKTFVGSKRIKFKQQSSSDKLGFALYNNGGGEVGYLEFNTDNNTPKLVLGNWRNSSSHPAATYIGIANEDGQYSAQYYYLAPKAADAKTPFGLTSSKKNFFMPLGWKVDSSTMVTADNTGVVDLSSYIGGGGGGGTITVDTELSSTSTNPVQNKVIYEAIGDIESLLASI